MASILSTVARREWSWPNGRGGLILLLQAHECASISECDAWDFAVDITELRQCGMCENELRWLMKMDYIEHRIEATMLGDTSRCFLPQGGLKFALGSCFVLTLLGECYVRTLLHPANGQSHQYDLNGHRNGHSSTAVSSSFNQLRPTSNELSLPTGQAQHPPFKPVHEVSLSNETDIIQIRDTQKVIEITKDQRPTWDNERKELWFGPHLIKRFRFQSPNQEMILTVFHEEGWPAKIDDPLPSVPNQTPRQRLHDAIKNLNRHRLCRIIRFAGDGTGEGVRWERE